MANPGCRIASAEIQHLWAVARARRRSLEATVVRFRRSPLMLLAEAVGHEAVVIMHIILSLGVTVQRFVVNLLDRVGA